MFFVNNFCVPKLLTLKFLTQKEPICIEGKKERIVISKFSFREKLSCKNNSVYFLAMCANLPCKIEQFELEAVGVGILGTGFCF